MATTKKPVKSTGKLKPIRSEMSVLIIEDNVPLPERGVRDPLFLQQAVDILKKIKPKQSFVVPKSKLHSVKRLVKTEFDHLVVKGQVIQPENKFARIWRVR